MQVTAKTLINNRETLKSYSKSQNIPIFYTLSSVSRLNLKNN